MAYLLDGLDLAKEAGRATLNQGDVRSQAHLVDISAGFEVVEGVKDNVESLIPLNIELRVLDVCMICHELHIRIEPLRRLLRNLLQSAAARHLQPQSRTYNGLRLLDMFHPK